MPRPALVAAILVVMGVVAAFATPTANADCDGPYASFREAAPTAERVIVGDIIHLRSVEWGDGEGTSSRFTVRGWSLLDGVQPVKIDVEDLLSTGCSGYLVARFGDVVAIAFDGVAFTNRQTVNAIAWIDREPPNRVGLERITLQGAFDLVGVPRPAVLPSPPAPEAVPTPDASPSWALLGATITVLLVGAGSFARLLRR